MKESKENHVETQEVNKNKLESENSSSESASSESSKSSKSNEESASAKTNASEANEKNSTESAKRTHTDSPTQSREKIVEALKQVIDPEIHINIVDLGLVYRVDVAENLKRIVVDFTLTTPGCPLADEIEENISKMCHTVFPSAEIETNLVWVPMWSADFMSEDARLELGFPI